MIEEIRTNRAEPKFDSLASGAEDGKKKSGNPKIQLGQPGAVNLGRKE